MNPRHGRFLSPVKSPDRQVSSSGLHRGPRIRAFLAVLSLVILLATAAADTAHAVSASPDEKPADVPGATDETAGTPVSFYRNVAAEDIAAALHQLNQFSGIDVIILGRGGGSSEDLAAFNAVLAKHSLKGIAAVAKKNRRQ